MGDEHHRGAQLLPEADHLVLQIKAHLDVHLAVGLVHQQQVRLHGKGAADDHALLAAHRQLPGVGLAVGPQAHQLHDAVHPFFRLFGRHMLDAQPEGDVLFHREPGKGGGLLKHKGQVVAAGVRRFAVDEQLAAGGLDEPGEQVEKSGLSAAGGAHHAQKLSLADVEAHIVQHQQVAEFLGQVAHLHLHRPLVHFAHGRFLLYRKVHRPGYLLP